MALFLIKMSEHGSSTNIASIMPTKSVSMDRSSTNLASVMVAKGWPKRTRLHEAPQY